MVTLMKEKMTSMEQILLEEEQKGSSFDHFMALVNLSKELAPLHYNPNEILHIWKKHRLHNERQNVLRHEPLMISGFSEIIGEEHMRNCLNEGGVFATFHYGDYRHVPFQLVKSLQLDKSNSVDIVVDRESYQSETSLTIWNELRDIYNTNYIISEVENSGLKLLRKLRSGRSIFLYLDGNSGSGDDSQPLSVDHITSKVSIRSGIFRLIQLLNKPLCVLIADQNENGEARLTAHPLIRINKSNFQDSVDVCYSIFTTALKEKPDLWRFWYRHHRYVLGWKDIEKSYQPNIDWHSDNGVYGVDLRDGNLYKRS